MTGKISFSGGARFRVTSITDLRCPGKPLLSIKVSLKNLLFAKPPSSSARHELLKIDGRLLEVRVRLNPRARRMIVKVNPATGEISVTAPSRRGLAHALDFARGEKDWIAGQLAKAPGPVALAPGAMIPLRGKPHEIRAAARGPAPVWREDGVIWVRGQAAHASAPGAGFPEKRSAQGLRNLRAGACRKAWRQAVAHHGARHGQPLGLLFFGALAVLFLAADPGAGFRAGLCGGA